MSEPARTSAIPRSNAAKAPNGGHSAPATLLDLVAAAADIAGSDREAVAIVSHLLVARPVHCAGRQIVVGEDDGLQHRSHGVLLVEPDPSRRARHGRALEQQGYVCYRFADEGDAVRFLLGHLGDVGAIALGGPTTGRAPLRLLRLALRLLPKVELIPRSALEERPQRAAAHADVRPSVAAACAS